MKATAPSSARARRVREVLDRLQRYYADGLDRLSTEHGDGTNMAPASWLRDGGRHGGGTRLEATESALLNRASLNVSAVHYDDLPDKRLSSATALSCIVHPQHPRAPSMHMHVSWTELRDGSGGWRLMADLNPSIVDDDDQRTFLNAIARGLASLPDETVAEAIEQGDRYFLIPALERKRGVAHAYLEQYNSGDEEADLALAERFTTTIIDTYLTIVDNALRVAGEPTEEQRAQQLHYHTVYLFQVLTLDRGTSSGLLVHDDNDAGILGSLPNRIDRSLLASWKDRMPRPQDELLQAIVDTLPVESPSVLTTDVRIALAQVVRHHFKEHPEALKYQARGRVLPPTVANHGSK